MRIFHIVLLVLCAPSSALAQQQPANCGTSDENLPPEVRDRITRLPAILQSQRARTKAGERRICRIGIEIDYQTYIQYDSDTSLITRKVFEDIAKVSEVYEKEINTRIVVAGIRFWKDPGTDPFGTTDNTYTLLDILAGLPAPNFATDKRMYLYTKQLNGPGGVAYLGGLFNVSALGIPQLMMHEIGHNFGSPHTHNCMWPGGPIDFCAGIEGACYDGALGSLSKVEGTIMSYCVAAQTFHPLCQALMKNYAENALQKIDAPPAAPRLNKHTSLAPSDFYTWDVVPDALTYDVLIANHLDFSDARTMVTGFNGISLMDMRPGIPMYIKARAVNPFGKSDWSEVATLQPSTPELSRPALNVFPETQSIFENGAPITLSYQAVEGATAYEVQVTSYLDPYFRYPVATLNTTELNAGFVQNYSGLFYWRARAVKGNVKGPWSATDYFSVNPKVGSQFFIPGQEKSDALPTGFPFAYYTTTFYSKSVITVSKNSDFSSPFYKREFVSYRDARDALSGLPVNSTLYVKVEEWNLDEQYYPKRKIADYSFTIKTGSDMPVGNLTFIAGIDADVFNVSQPKMAITEKAVWLESPSFGFVKLDKSSLTFEIYNRDNTAALIGNTYITKPLVTDSNGHINVISQASNGFIRQVMLPSDTPGADAVVNKIFFAGDVEGCSPAHGLYWNRNGIYRVVSGLLNTISVPANNRQFAQVAVAGGKIWIMQTDNFGGGEIIALDAASGNEVQRFSNANHPDLLYYMNQMVVNDKGQILVRQFDPTINGFRVSLWTDGKWSAYMGQSSTFSGNIQSIAVSPKGDLYVLTKRTGHGIYRHDNGQWKEVADIGLENIADDFVPDDNDDIWLIGQYGLVRVNIARFDLTSIDKKDYCPGDTLTAIVSTNGGVDLQKPFSAVFTKPSGETVSVNGLSLQGTQIKIRIPDGLSGTGLYVQLKSSDPEILTPGKRQLSIRELPTATIKADKTVLIPGKDTAVVTITLTGQSPWSFLMWDNTRATSETATFLKKFVLAQPDDFELKINGLSDQYCVNGIVRNTVKITANIITGNAEPALPLVNIYPNPSSDRILVHYEQQGAKASHYFISDTRGRQVASLKTASNITEWDIHELSAGTYILWTVQNGHKRSWKIVKN